MDEVRASAKQVVVLPWSFPPKCMESGDYMRRVLQTTNHITYAYGNLPGDAQMQTPFMRQGLQQTLWRKTLKHFGINL